MLSSRRSTDDGSASIELMTAGLVLLVPLVYLVLLVSTVQGAALAVEGGSRQAARVFVQQADESLARDAAQRAVSVALDDFGLDAADADVSVVCSDDDCLTRGELVTVEVTTSVPLPLTPPVLQLDVGLAVPISAVATVQVSRFAERGSG
jgi:hypothetical protein